jgi:hypothetical protein
MAPRRKHPVLPAARRSYKRPTLVDYGSIPARTLSAVQVGSLFDIMLAKQSKKL